jgi:DNA-binding NarL/FixJ family response regulator
VYNAVENQVEGSDVGSLDLRGSLRSVLAYSVAGLRGGSAAEPPPVPRPTPLTRREEEVVVLVARGLTNHEVADQLVLSERTVEAHLDHVRSKLGLRSRAHIAAWAVEQRLTDAG